MSSYANKQPFSFRESLKHEDQVQMQIKDCRTAFNLGNRISIHNTVGMLENLVTPNIVDKEYLDAMLEVNMVWSRELVKRERAYKKEYDEAGCPDVVEEPDRVPPIYHYQRKFQILGAVFERRGLMFKQKVEEDDE